MSSSSTIRRDGLREVGNGQPVTEFRIVMKMARNDREVWVRCDTLYTPSQQRSDCLIHIVAGTIREILPARTRRKVAPEALIYEPGAIVAPGFIDLHVHGARGHDFMEGSLDALQEISAALASHGTTCFLATTLSAPAAEIETALAGFAAHRRKIADGARPLGLHMEGPYLNPDRRGTHGINYLKKADVGEFRHFLELSENTLRKITIAPEMDPELSVTRQAASLGIRVSIGHTDATLDQARAAVEAGAHDATHVFNAMRPLHQREPGVLGLVLADKRVFAEVIADGMHVHPLVLELLLRLKGIQAIILVSDGISAVDMPDGVYRLGIDEVVVQGGKCTNPAGTLAGSILMLDRAVRNLVDWGQLSLQQAVIAATATPAISMGIEAAKGVVAPGADADLVFLDPQFQVVKTMVAGRVVYSR